ncbi:MAG: hypothetical protein LJE70_12435 [Chromatiaceae bacterium]|jgi:DNA-directed RNA polymerase sigma subunit (sigma70/sigma32)|nr:hypothetical protein [Chromatiaceae bacterium]
MTRQEIAAVLGVSRERVGQVERRALGKCRHWCEYREWRLEEMLTERREVEPEHQDPQ